ncbi:hypothetical protein WA026_019386 [Henosepilachna vigintioctopunctata]|uniref:Uncharacterized protein n=1 Tax=Henosepilachna vigintioctopunctata TaxID=420089 RepID=A0AAW1U1L3_9CUCU
MKQRTAAQNIWFNKQCLKMSLVPNYVKVKFNINNTLTEKLKNMVQKQWIREEIISLHKKRHICRSYLKLVHTHLFHYLHAIEFDILDDTVREKKSKIIHIRCQTQQKKISVLLEKQHKPTTSQVTPPIYDFYLKFKNFSNSSFDTEENEILNKGPKYSLDFMKKQGKEILGVNLEVAIQQNLKNN